MRNKSILGLWYKIGIFNLKLGCCWRSTVWKSQKEFFKIFIGSGFFPQCVSIRPQYYRLSMIGMNTVKHLLKYFWHLSPFLGFVALPQYTFIFRIINIGEMNQSLELWESIMYSLSIKLIIQTRRILRIKGESINEYPKTTFIILDQWF
jgi:hypothetical protein